MKYFILAFKKWNDINGRANLKEFWFYTLFYYIFYFVSYLLDLYIYNDIFLSTGEFVSEDFEDGGIVTLIYWIINIIPSITVSIRRLHDVNKSGWNLLWYLTIIGIVYVIFLHILRGTKGDNDYGSPSNNRPDYKDMNEDDKQKEEEVYNKINELVSQVKSEVDEEELYENKSGSFENDSNENKYFVKDTVTGETLKVNKEDYQKVTEDYLEHMKDTALYRMPGLSGLQVYLKDRPNISRIFNELINYVDDGNSVREYLEKANIIDNEDSWIIYGALLDISKFYKNLLDKEEIPLVRKDYNTCIEAIKIFEEDVWTDEELALLNCLIIEIEWASGEMNKSPDFKNVVINSILSAIKINMPDEERSEYSEKIMQIQNLGEKLYSPENFEGGNLLKIKDDYNSLTIPKQNHISKCVSMLMDDNKHPKKVEMAKFFGIPIMNVNYDSEGHIFFT